MIVYADWQVRNAQRKYPLDENASAAGDDGVQLPESFLVDVQIWVPKYVYDDLETLRYVYLASAQVSSQLVSLTLLGCTDALGSPNAQFVPLASLALVKPVVPYKNYAVEPLLDGVMGWVAFGHLVAGDGTFSLLFSQPDQSMLIPRAVRYYDYLPIPSITAEGGFSQISGDVKISGELPIIAEIKPMRLFGETSDRDMLVIGLQQTENTLAEFSGRCGKRPETGNCLKTPITSISGITPDCAGNIQLEFAPEIMIRYFSNPLYPAVDPINPLRGGMCLDTLYSLDQACNKVQTLPDDAGFLPGEFVWSRPCDLHLPFSVTFTGPGDLKGAQVTAGFHWFDGYDLWLSAGYNPSAEITTCFKTVDTALIGNTYREHTVNFGNTPNNAEVGIFVCDLINTRVLLTVIKGGAWAVTRWSKALNAADSTLAGGSWGAGDITSLSATMYHTRRLVLKANGGVLLDYTFSDSDIYYDPTGQVGAYVGGSSIGDPTMHPAVQVTSYSVSDS
jgi:hypothetical protein